MKKLLFFLSVALFTSTALHAAFTPLYFTMPASAVTVTATFKQTPQTAIGNTFGTADTTVRKVLIDGQVYILRNGKTYTLTGIEVK